jgi:hypothetical protein
MPELNFILIGRIPGEGLFIHKDDLILLSNENSSSQIKCIAIDFITRKTSIPATIEQMEKVCPHEPVTSEGEREIITELLIDTLLEKKINA